MAHGYLLLAGAVQDDVDLFVGQLADGGVRRKVKLAGHGCHHTGVPDIGSAGAGPGHNGAFQQRQAAVLDDQRRVDFKLVAEAGADGASAVGAVEAEGAGFYFGQADAAGHAGELLAEHQVVAFRPGHSEDAFAFPQGRFHRFGNAAGFGVAADDEAVNHDVDVVPFLLVQGQGVGVLDKHYFAIDADADETGAAGGVKDIPVFALFAADFGGQESNAGGFGQGEDGVHNLLHRLAGHGVAALGAVGLADAGEQQPQVVVDLRNGAYGGARVVGNALLVNGNGRRKPFYVVHIGLVHTAQELAGVGGEGFHIAPLPLGIDGVKGKAAFAGAGDAGDDHQLLPGDGDIHVFEVVLAGAFDVDDFLRHLANPLALHQDGETGLGEMAVVGKGFADAPFLHYLEAGAVHEAPLLVGAGVVVVNRVPELLGPQRDNPDVGVGRNIAQEVHCRPSHGGSEFPEKIQHLYQGHFAGHHWAAA